MTEKTTISRRSVAKGVAWTVPAVAVAAATPAYAVSGRGVVYDTTNSLWCGNNGQGQTKVKWCFRLGGATSATVTITSFSYTDGTTTWTNTSQTTSPLLPVTIPVTSSTTASCSNIVSFKVAGKFDPAKTYTMTVNFTVTKAEGITSTGTKTLRLNNACAL